MAMTPAEMDEVLDRHFAGEEAHDMEAVLATLTEDVEHDVVGLGLNHGHEAVTKVYALLFAETTDEVYKPVRRLYGENHLVDEVLATGLVTGPNLFGPAAVGKVITYRLLHVIDFRDGLISRENVWMDTGAIMAQLATAPE
jgi:ketosteroid isomerase-like protein